jgi:predicted oxidoreductase (fatty acid repression mutant protein)
VRPMELYVYVAVAMTFWVINSNQVLFFVDYESLAPIKEKFAIYADKFDPFALESNAMSQYFGEYTSL